MPKGTPNIQTKATDRYQKKVGLIAKSFKIKKDIANDFKNTCDSLGISQASVISNFMKEFCEKNVVKKEG